MTYRVAPLSHGICFQNFMHFLYTNLVPHRFPQSLRCCKHWCCNCMQICDLGNLIKQLHLHGCFQCAQCRPMDSEVQRAVMLRRLTALSVFEAGLKSASSCAHAQCMLSAGSQHHMGTAACFTSPFNGNFTKAPLPAATMIATHTHQHQDAGLTDDNLSLRHCLRPLDGQQGCKQHGTQSIPGWCCPVPIRQSSAPEPRPWLGYQ